MNSTQRLHQTAVFTTQYYVRAGSVLANVLVSRYLEPIVRVIDQVQSHYQ